MDRHLKLQRFSCIILYFLNLSVLPDDLGMCWYVNLFISLNFSYQQFPTMCAKMCTDYVTGLFKQLVSLL